MRTILIKKYGHISVINVDYMYVINKVAIMNDENDLAVVCCKETCCADGCCSDGCKTGECSSTCCRDGCCDDSDNCC